MYTIAQRYLSVKFVMRNNHAHIAIAWDVYLFTWRKNFLHLAGFFDLSLRQQVWFMQDNIN